MTITTVNNKKTVLMTREEWIEKTGLNTLNQNKKYTILGTELPVIISPRA